MKTKRLFFSSESIPHEDLVRFCDERNMTLIAKSFLDYEALPFAWQGEEEVIFFSSPRAVQFFLAGHEAGVEGKLVACVGSGTARFLVEHGIQPDFIGEKAGDTARVANDFMAWLNERSVFFPLAADSLQTISSRIPDKQKQIQAVYRTVYLDLEIAACSWYVFTSPSNVNAFLAKNELPQEIQLIAWGRSTQNALERLGLTVNTTLETASMAELIAYLSA